MTSIIANQKSQPPQRVSFTHQYIAFHIHPEGQHHIYYYWRAHGKEGNVYKPQAYARAGHT